MQLPGAALGAGLAVALVLGLAVPVVGAAGADVEGPAHEHRARPGDTLIGLGRLYLADPGQWPAVQRINAIRDPRRIPLGSVVRIPLSLMRTEPAPARVTAVSGGVRSGAVGVTTGQSLPEGSEVSTDADSHVTVQLVDGTVLRLRSGARVLIDESRRLPAADVTRSGVKLQQGQVEVEARPARGGQPGFRIGTPQGVLGVRGTEFRVDSTGSQTRTEVLEGVVAASGPGGGGVERRVLAGFGTVIDAAGQVALPAPLLPAPDVSGLPALQERPLVRLNLPALAGAAAWRVQVGADERFDRLLADVRSATPELRIAGLADGRYPMRLRAVAANGLEGRDARATLTLKARPEPPLPRAPAPRAVIRGTAVDFAWAASSEARRYRLQVARAEAGADPFAAPMHDVRDLDGLAHALGDLPPGLYVWRLASVREGGDQGPFGDPLGFELRALPPAAAPPGPPAVGDDSIRVFWQGLPGQRFDFQLARDEAFTQLLEDRQLDRTEIELPLPGSGRFHVRLRARDADGFVGPWSASQHVDVFACVRDSRGACVRVEGGTLRLQ